MPEKSYLNKQVFDIRLKDFRDALAALQQQFEAQCYACFGGKAKIMTSASVRSILGTGSHRYSSL